MEVRVTLKDPSVALGLARTVNNFLELARQIRQLDYDAVLTEYHEFTTFTAMYPDAGTGSPDELAYLALGLCGESGKVAEHIKKLMRGDRVEGLKKEEVEKELGDVFYYLVRLCYAAGTTPERVLATNIEKLCKRKVEGHIKGMGSNR